MSWFSMSRITCLSIFSGSSALSMRSLRLARMSAETRSMSAMTSSNSSLGLFDRDLRVDGQRLPALVADRLDATKELGHLHARKRLEERRHLSRHLGHVAGDLVGAGSVAIARGDDRDLVDLRE